LKKSPTGLLVAGWWTTSTIGCGVFEPVPE